MRGPHKTLLAPFPAALPCPHERAPNEARERVLRIAPIRAHTARCAHDPCMPSIIGRISHLLVMLLTARRFASTHTASVLAEHLGYRDTHEESNHFCCLSVLPGRRQSSTQHNSGRKSRCGGASLKPSYPHDPGGKRFSICGAEGPARLHQRKRWAPRAPLASRADPERSESNGQYFGT